MWELLGCGIGAALGMGFAENKGQHWAVRVLCVVLAIVGAVAGLFFALVGGKDSPVGGVLVGAVLAFVLVSVASGLSWLVRWTRGVKGQ